MIRVEYAVKREIENVEFSEQQCEEFREEIRKGLIDKGVQPDEQQVENRLTEKLEELAKDRTLNDQGHSDLTREIEHGDAVEI